MNWEELEEHEENKARVEVRIRLAVYRFCCEHLDKRFYVDELRKFVIRTCGTVAPDSPGRILRELRLKELIAYECVSRSESLYEVTAVYGKKAKSAGEGEHGPE